MSGAPGFAPWRLAGWRGSLRLRLFVGTLVWVLMAIAVAGWGLRALFAEHIAQQLRSQLVLQLDRLSAGVNLQGDGRIGVQPAPSDQRLQQPLSGLYWQIDQLDAAGRGTAHAGVQRSRSLWDQTLDWSRFAPQGGAAALVHGRLPMAQGQPGKADRWLEVVSRELQLPEAGAPPLRLMVAADGSLLAEPLQRFTRMLAMALGTLALGLIAAVAIQLQLALAPLAAIRRQLAAIRQGDAAELQGRHPSELMPLVQEFNHVLQTNAEMVQRARTQAGNLAHAVNTPLTILANAAAQQDSALAELVREQVASASRQVEHHLARARAAATQAAGLRTPLQPPLQSLVRTMARLHAGRGIRFEIEGRPEDWDFRGDVQDLMEMLGNLLDNAGKWARSTVRLQVQGQDQCVVLCVDDDGPGIEQQARERIFERGRRLDEKRPGTGLGLDIVRDLVQSYGGRIEARTAPLGGLRMRLELPAIPHADTPARPSIQGQDSTKA
ncbi:sensor histidine kinase [Comamonas terrae]|uniref:histidine kinase n=1 Tax=Comamonas terrae TaxID=673548 RepID=A0ABW5UHR4_9BURK|nr:sensor histidine kinase [Comamonas terrae]